ncbi:histone-lysine N-methyltransferase ASHH3-like isoform X2 [Lycium ferocissimum]|uniref:histone-lysine N-methyltransferase ASHH3-like isoform X2 n=1 Tax=Lycium ferocissimum TaxID=112874 RepID=UPI002816513A|nr:histone-lysine N-methyltransferase ASHH3-like isoform X2 [Lycium ferocissimum]XP_059278424.1 histone-lysine N-methyltransferase ASHH3-like isoform X2 [Lycium ferocissimum]XP_059278425.1 histone-lysine N-methyltransferase ASHH3-like isoform X2 [Lycium ferocissimum]
MIEPMPTTKKSATHGGIGHVFNKLTSEIGEPVDFELPDWLHKWQPTAYTYIKRNIYLTKKVKRRVEDDGIFCSCSSVAGSSDVCGSDCHCSMLWSSCSSGCKCGSSCLNKPFHKRPVKKMKTVKTEKCGSGIVADEDIKRKEFVIEYVGEVIDDKTCEERLWKMKHSGETNFYLCEINRDMVIDATYKGNKSRYINHSCCPNTEMQRWIIDGETRIGIFATRDIRRGEHLTYDYQFVQFGADQDCHCGAIECKRKLGIKPNKIKLPSSDAALKLVASQVAAASLKVKALLSAKHDYQTGVPPKGSSNCDSAQRIRRPRNCIGQLVRIIRSFDRSPGDSLEKFLCGNSIHWSFGIIKRFDSITKKHLIMFEDGSVEYLDMSKEDWEFCNSV